MPADVFDIDVDSVVSMPTLIPIIYRYRFDADSIPIARHLVDDINIDIGTVPKSISTSIPIPIPTHVILLPLSRSPFRLTWFQFLVDSVNERHLVRLGATDPTDYARGACSMHFQVSRSATNQAKLQRSQTQIVIKGYSLGYYQGTPVGFDSIIVGEGTAMATILTRKYTYPVSSDCSLLLSAWINAPPLGVDGCDLFKTGPTLLL